MSVLTDNLTWYEKVMLYYAESNIGPRRSRPHILDDSASQAIISAAVLNQAIAFQQQGDRASAYLLLAEAANNPTYLNAAQVSTASGPIVGGPAE